MHPILVCLPVVLLSDCVECSAGIYIDDLSDECYNGRIIHSYLTNGMGVNDVSISMIAKEDVNCTVTYLVHERVHIIVVIEFLDWIPGELHCGTVNNSIIISLNNEYTENICSEMENENIYRKLGKKEISVVVQSLRDMKTLKITATSVATSTKGRCHDFEVSCDYDNDLYCMTDFVKCDGHVNCGIRNKYDENETHCEKLYSVKPDMVIVGIITLFVSICLLVSIMRRLLPKREGIFIVKEDGTLSEKDRMTSENSYELDIRILYSEPGMAGVESIIEETSQYKRRIFRKGFKRKDS